MRSGIGSVASRRGLALVAVATAAGFQAEACNGPAAEPETVGSMRGPGGGGATTPEAGGGDAGPGSDATIGRGVTTLASGVLSPQVLVLGPSTVYWASAQVATAGIGDASFGTGGIESVPRTGGARTTVIGGLAAPHDLALVNDTLVFDQTAQGGMIAAYTLGATVIDELATGFTLPLPFNLDGTTLYFATSQGSDLDVESILTSGGNVVKVGTHAGAYTPIAIARDESSLYVLATTGSNGGAIVAYPSGGKPSVLWSSSTVTPVDLVLVGSTLYWTVTGTPLDGEVLAVGITGGSAEVIASNLENPAKLAADGATLYFTTSVAAGSIQSIGGGGAITTLASGLDFPYAIAVDDAVYFTTATTVGRVPK